MVKCLLTDAIIKPEERSLYFFILFQRITTCLIKSLAGFSFELGTLMSLKIRPVPELPSEAFITQDAIGQVRILGLG